MADVRYWIDTEFQDDGVRLHVLSVGAVAEDGREFYAVCSDFPFAAANEWHHQHTLPLLPPRGHPACADTATVARRLRDFIGYDLPEFWAMCSPWDWLGVVRLFGRIEDAPDGWPMIAFDLWQVEHHAGCRCRPPNPGPAHDALVDARWHRLVYDHLVAEHHLSEPPPSLRS